MSNDIRKMIKQDLEKGKDFKYLTETYGNKMEMQDLVFIYYDLTSGGGKRATDYNIFTLPKYIYLVNFGVLSIADQDYRHELSIRRRLDSKILFNLDVSVRHMIQIKDTMSNTGIIKAWDYLIGDLGTFEITKESDMRALNSGESHYIDFNFVEAKHRVENYNLNDLLYRYYYLPDKVEDIKETILRLSNELSDITLKQFFSYISGMQIRDMNGLTYLIHIILKISEVFEKDNTILDKNGSDLIFKIVDEIDNYNQDKLVKYIYNVKGDGNWIG